MPAGASSNWSLTVLGAGHAGIPHNGRVPTLEEAKAQLQASFKKWLVWAKLEEADNDETRPLVDRTRGEGKR